jgi:signal transduction histidine kinase/HAMP domain-containing protein
MRASLQTRWARASLRWRLTLILCVIISVILAGQAVLGLSGEVAELDHRVSTQGTLLAYGAASSCERLLDAPDPARFDPVIDRLRRTVDLIEVAVLDRRGEVIGHSNSARVGDRYAAHLSSAFGLEVPDRGLSALAGGPMAYHTAAPILRGTRVLGYVHLRFRSDEVSRRAAFIVLATGGWALVWLAVGATAAGLYVRRITEPLARLTDAARALAAGDVTALGPATEGHADEVATLQSAFAQLRDDLGAERRTNAALLAQVQGLNDRLEQKVVSVSADLREAHAHLSAIVSALDEGVVSCTPAGVVRQLNAGARRQLAGLSEPTEGLPVEALIPDGAPLARALECVMTARRSTRLELSRPESDTGLRRHLVFRLYPLGNAVGAVLTVVDETERRALETQLRQSDRLASMGTLAAGLAHELGNAMHIIHGFSAVLLSRVAADAPYRGDVEAISDENKAAIRLLERFLRFARPSESAQRTVDLVDLVRGALDLCAVELGQRGVEICDALSEDLGAVRCDRRLLQQVFVNLFLNAADAMSNAPTRRLTVSGHVGGARAEIHVRDSGPGIAGALRDRIFDPFFTTKQGSGTGLGLSIAHQIVEGHGGHLALLDAAPGATFAVDLPVQGDS